MIKGSRDMSVEEYTKTIQQTSRDHCVKNKPLLKYQMPTSFKPIFSFNNLPSSRVQTVKNSMN